MSATAPPKPTQPAASATDDVELDFDVTGMTCGSCAARVQRTLNRQPGVSEALVNYATARASVTFDPAATDSTQLAEAVRHAGYDATPARTLEAQDDQEPHEQRSLRWRVIVAIPLAIAIVALTYAAPHATLARWLTFALVLPIQFWCGWPFLRSAWVRARARSANMDTLIALSTLASFTYSTVMLILQTRGYQHGVNVGQLEMRLDYDMSATIITALLIARWCEARARQQAGRALSELTHLAASKARLVDPDDATKERMVPASEVRIGDVFVLRPGTGCRSTGWCWTAHRRSTSRC